MAGLVRPAVAEDATGIGSAHVRSWQAAYVGLVPQSILDRMSVERRAASWRRSIERDGTERVWVVEEDGRIRGFAAVGSARDDDLPEGTGELYAIYLEPEAWSAGLGRSLIERAVEELRSRFSGPLVLWVLTGNARARRFYEIAGWKPDGTRRELDFDGSPIEEMRYVLDDADRIRGRKPS